MKKRRKNVAGIIKCLNGKMALTEMYVSVECIVLGLWKSLIFLLYSQHLHMNTFDDVNKFEIKAPDIRGIRYYLNSAKLLRYT